MKVGCCRLQGHRVIDSLLPIINCDPCTKFCRGYALLEIVLRLLFQSSSHRISVRLPFLPKSCVQILSAHNVGSDGPTQSVMVKKTTKLPIRDWMIVKNNIVANFVKKTMRHKSMLTAAARVVTAAARILGPR